MRNVSLKKFNTPSENIYVSHETLFPGYAICEVFGAASSHLKTNTRWNMLLMKQTNQLLWILVYVPEMPNVGNIYINVCYLYIIPGKDQHLPSWYHLREHLPFQWPKDTGLQLPLPGYQVFLGFSYRTACSAQLILMVWTQFHQYINLICIKCT